MNRTFLDILKGFALAGLLLFALGLILRATSALAQPTHPAPILARTPPAFPPLPPGLAAPDPFLFPPFSLPPPMPSPQSPGWYYMVTHDGKWQCFGYYTNDAHWGSLFDASHDQKFLERYRAIVVFTNRNDTESGRVLWHWKPGFNQLPDTSLLPRTATVIADDQPPVISSFDVRQSVPSDFPIKVAFAESRYNGPCYDPTTGITVQQAIHMTWPVTSNYVYTGWYASGLSGPWAEWPTPTNLHPARGQGLFSTFVPVYPNGNRLYQVRANPSDGVTYP